MLSGLIELYKINLAPPKQPSLPQIDESTLDKSVRNSTFLSFPVTL